ncbi:MAG: M15 family metallopeptidase, partial [Pseudomonadales bacterium]
MSPQSRLQHLTGQDDSLIENHSLYGAIHQQALQPYLDLRADAKEAGFDLAIASGYRDFARQLAIWNDKATGKRPVLDKQGQPLDMMSLSSWQQVQSILRWSALPGASRHHWGTDIDVYDRAAVAEDYWVQLSSEEVADDGPFGPLHSWLDRQIESGQAKGFFRPYQRDTGGIAPERWHLSYAPVSCQYQSEFMIEDFVGFLSDKPLRLKAVVLD